MRKFPPTHPQPGQRVMLKGGFVADWPLTQALIRREFDEATAADFALIKSQPETEQHILDYCDFIRRSESVL